MNSNIYPRRKTKRKIRSLGGAAKGAFSCFLFVPVYPKEHYMVRQVHTNVNMVLADANRVTRLQSLVENHLCIMLPP